MTEEVPSQLASRRLPAPMAVFRLGTGGPKPGFHVVILEQIVTAQAHQIAPVQVGPMLKHTGQQFDLSRWNRSESLGMVHK